MQADSEQAQGRLIFETIVMLSERFRDRGLLPTDLLWLMAAAAAEIINSGESAPETIFAAFERRVRFCLQFGSLRALGNRSTADQSFADLTGPGAEQPKPRNKA